MDAQKRSWPALLSLDAKRAVPLHRQLYAELRQAIVNGRFAPGVALPASRVLARDLRISRNTVLAAFEQLLAEGYLVSRHGSGTFVTESLPDDMLWLRNPPSGEKREQISLGLSNRGERLGRGSNFFPPVKPQPFRHGLPALDSFPKRLWARIASREWRGISTKTLSYGDAAGYRPLREAVATYLAQARAVRCTADQIMMVAGSQQALYLVAHLLLDPGDAVWFEDPGYLGARAAFQAAGARIVPAPVDGEGLSVVAAKKRGGRACVAYVTPSNQYPTTVTMSLGRRLELLDWARRARMWIIEDDYDSEFRYTSRPIASLQGLDPSGRVIYIGTFSKLLAPCLRLGYIVLPAALVDSFTAASAVITRHLPSLEQVALAAFIGEGHLARHVRQMRQLYEQRRSHLVSAVREELSEWLEIQPPDAGTHALAWLKSGLDDKSVAEAARPEGVELRAFSTYCLRPAKRSGLILGYGAFGRAEIRSGVQRLARILRSF